MIFVVSLLDVKEVSKPKFISFSEIPCSMRGSAARLLSRPIYRITHLDACNSEKREPWLEWRNSLKLIPTSSTLCAYFGYGFVSLNTFIKEKIDGVEEKEELNGNDYSRIFSEKAKKYGTDNEPKAKDLYRSYLDRIQGDYIQIEDGEISYLSEISYGEDKTKVICTPDLLIVCITAKFRGNMVAEIKCPFKVINERGQKSILIVANEFIQTHRKGKENAFIQAATYALWNQAVVFHTVFYFTDSVDQEMIVIFCYKTTEALFDLIFSSVKETESMLKEYSEGKIKKNYRTPNGIKNQLKQVMDDCYFNCIMFGL